MSEFLSNLAARSQGTFVAIAPRVPSRFEPTRRADGLLAGRRPPTEEGLEEFSEMDGTAGVEAPAADPMENRSLARGRTGPTREMDSSPARPGSLLSSSESEPEMLAIRPAESTVPHAQSRETPLAPREPVLRARRIPGSQSAGSPTHASSQTVSSQAEADQSLDPASTPASRPAFAPASAQRHEAI